MLILNAEFFIQTQGVWISSQTSHKTRHEYFSHLWGTKMPQHTALIVFACPHKYSCIFLGNFKTSPSFSMLSSGLIIVAPSIYYL